MMGGIGDIVCRIARKSIRQGPVAISGVFIALSLELCSKIAQICLLDQTSLAVLGGPYILGTNPAD